MSDPTPTSAPESADIPAEVDPNDPAWELEPESEDEA